MDLARVSHTTDPVRHNPEADVKQNHEAPSQLSLQFHLKSFYSYRRCSGQLLEGRLLMERFQNREQAGRQLAAALVRFQSEKPVLLAVPNGGIAVASLVAENLGTALMVVPMRSLQVPWAPDVIFGYTSANGALHLNQPLIGQTRLSPQQIYQISKKRGLALQTDLASWDIHVPQTWVVEPL